MNIFYLDEDVVLCARAHCDKHLVKMPLETAQLLCTARHVLGSAETPQYKSTHLNHPCAVWVRQSYSHYTWLCSFGIALCEEYTFRYGKVHKCQAVIEKCAEDAPKIEKFETYDPWKWTDPPQCMPEDYRQKDTVSAYQEYYVAEKFDIATWKPPRTEPVWWQCMVEDWQ